MAKGFFKDKATVGFFLALFLCYLSALLYVNTQINISEDDAYTLHTSSRDFLGIIKQSVKFEAQPPGYFIVLSLWRHFHSSIFFARLFSILCIVAAGFFFNKLLQFLVGNDKKQVSLWGTAAFLLNPFSLWAAFQIRTYAFVILLSTLLSFFFFKYLFEKKRKYLVGFLFVSLIGIYTQYFLLYIIAAFVLAVLVWEGWKPFLKFCLYLLPVALLFLPNLIFLSSQVGVVKAETTDGYVFRTLGYIRYFSYQLILPTQSVSVSWISYLIMGLFIICFLAIWIRLYKKALPTDTLFFKKINMAIFAVFAGLFFFWLSFSVVKVSFDVRYLSFVYPLLFFCTGIFFKATYKLYRILFGVLIIYFFMLAYTTYKHPVNGYDFKTVSSYVSKIEKPQEPILMYRPALALPFVQYYNGKNKIYPIPASVNFDTSYFVNVRDTFVLKQSLSGIPSSSYLLISDTTRREGALNMNRKMIDDYLHAHYTIVLDTFVHGWGKAKSLRVIRFEKQ